MTGQQCARKGTPKSSAPPALALALQVASQQHDHNFPAGNPPSRLPTTTLYPNISDRLPFHSARRTHVDSTLHASQVYIIPSDPWHDPPTP